MARIERIGSPSVPTSTEDVSPRAATPAEIAALPVEELLPLLEQCAIEHERCAIEHERIAVVERLARVRLARELPTLLRRNEPLLTAAQVAKRLTVSVDWVRDHGERLGIAVPLEGPMRYDPARVDALRRQRHRDA